eukprot:gene9379-19465_t
MTLAIGAFAFNARNPPRPVPSSMSAASNDQSKMKERLISPDDIASLFGSDCEVTYNAEDEIDFTDETPVKMSDEIPAKSSEQKAVTSSEESEVKSPVSLIKPAEIDIDPNDMYSDENMGYNLNRALDRETRNRIMDSISIDRKSNPADISREINYDPQATSKYRGDPMNYGAYRRWKLIEMQIKDKKSKKDDKNKSKKDSNEFFNSIKKLGSGPAPKGTPSGVGVAEPPPGMKNVKPKKAPGRKQGNKKVITPNDIDSLFAKKTTTTTTESEENDDEGDDDNNNNENKEKSSISTTTTSTTDSSNDLSLQKTFGFMIGSDEEIPDWILDAEKQEKKKKKAMKAKKTKKFTDDWRFWAACIAGTGFVTAFINIYQQTGGFGAERQELII